MDTHSSSPRELLKKVTKKSFKCIEKLTELKKKTIQVQNKTLCHSEGSLLAVKEHSYNLGKDSKVLISEDLSKIIDINTDKSNSSSTNQTKSIFQEIDKKYNEISSKSIAKPFNINNHLISDADLKKLVIKKYSEKKNLILNPWERSLQNFLTYARAGNFSNILFKRIVDNQSKITASCVLYEFDLKFRGIKLADTFVKRKFVRRYNELVKLQTLNADLITSVQATDLIREVRLGELHKMSIDVCMGPLEEAEEPLDPDKFPKESFRTPEKQKYKITDFSVLTHSLTPVVKTKLSINYLENLKDTPPNNRYIFDTKQTKKPNENNFVSNQFDSLNLNTIFDRPKKVETLRKDRKRFSFDYTSPKSTKKTDFELCLTPNRKLNFNRTTVPDFKQNIDFVPLNTTPKRVSSWLEPNFPEFRTEVTRKRSLEGIKTPEMIKLRRIENIMHNSADDEMPKLKTPEFKYGRNFFC